MQQGSGEGGRIDESLRINGGAEFYASRIYALRKLDFDPYVMIYDKPHAPRETRYLQRWVNNKIIFKTIDRFEDYDNRIG